MNGKRVSIVLAQHSELNMHFHHFWLPLEVVESGQSQNILEPIYACI